MEQEQKSQNKLFTLEGDWFGTQFYLLRRLWKHCLFGCFTTFRAGTFQKQLTIHLTSWLFLLFRQVADGANCFWHMGWRNPVPCFVCSPNSGRRISRGRAFKKHFWLYSCGFELFSSRKTPKTFYSPKVPVGGIFQAHSKSFENKQDALVQILIVFHIFKVPSGWWKIYMVTNLSNSKLFSLPPSSNHPQ